LSSLNEFWNANGQGKPEEKTNDNFNNYFSTGRFFLWFAHSNNFNTVSAIWLLLLF